MKTYRISTIAHQRAKTYEAAINATETLKTANYTGISAPNRYYTGYLGEWAFNELLNDIGVKAVWNINTSGYSDDCDFEIITYKTKIDVKTASQPFHRNLVIGEAQFKKRHADIYVGCKIQDGEVQIRGFATRDDIERIVPDSRMGSLSRSIRFEDLRHIETLSFIVPVVGS